ncbi:hypothetical protein [Aequorivita vladivostokensis]|uniref:Protein Kinase D n=1 Tax=Aequorivita vladivostokensis TaxID=171194 RepID=A0ABR5DIA1_9FLAO|nr:hypothetical protein [Aequorivita vladivostokensis]MAO47747.1 hypothetical protein [Aequorivita sp.]KJJ38497.1 Protein Kinase D [Aequorivita vladivostokensis]MDX1783457.1 hypothetical protein [Aequorivita vladivostokensis]HAV55503.1 hypothetical protein [Aequorivita sp.]HBL79045.1 hypothetical protein [Aequorivita sp.]|tara:strand:+ start:3230 stop:4582 length:1353 start_codon:yes stop_codon:yes gene_type:complete
MLITKSPNYKAVPLLLAIALVLFSCGKDDGPGPESEINGEIELIKTYGGSGIDEAVSVVETGDGNYMVLGTTRSSDGDITDRAGNDSDFWLLKLSKTGEIIWSKTYGGSDDENASRITKTNDGGYLLTGYTTSSDGDIYENAGFQDYWVVKVDNGGTILWEKTFGFSGSDQAFKAFQTSDGGYFVTGYFDVSASGGAGNDLQKGVLHGVGEFWGIKLNATGTIQWRRYFGGTNNDRSYDALETDDGGFLMTGTSESEDFDKTDPKGSYDYWAVRLKANGDLLWTKSFGGDEIDNSYASIKTQDGNYIMVGDSRSADQDVTAPRGNADAWLVKFDDNGSKIWQKSFGGSQFDTAHSIVQRSNGDYILSGHSRSSDGDLKTNNGVNDVWVFVIDQSGNLKFQNTIGGSSLDFASEAIETTDNKILVVGNSESDDLDIPSNKGSKDFLVIKIK